MRRKPLHTLCGGLAIALFSGCTVVGHEKVAGWPEMQIVEHHVPHHVMRERCVKYMAPTMSPEACAEFNFAARRCDLWFSADFPPPRAVVEHERLHCQGYDHIGQSTMRRLLATYGDVLPAAADAGSSSTGSTLAAARE